MKMKSIFRADANVCIASLPVIASLSAIVICSVATAVSPGQATPQSIAVGKALFEKHWPSGNPTLGGDGLGPLFNGVSCVACHHQGGSGGGGDARHNALTIGIEEMTITGGPVTDDVIATMVRSFHPGFIQRGGTMVNTLALPHHGGTDAYGSSRVSFLSQTGAQYSSRGGPQASAEVRRAISKPILFDNVIGEYRVQIRARAFGRNTTALYGSGLIDRVTDKQILAQSSLQKRHPEISGRPATQRDGEIGKFGWRGNIVSLLRFNDQACAAELGLKTKRIDQPADPIAQNYRNTTEDITDDQIRAMTHFVAALPAPRRQIPEDSETKSRVLLGEAAFAKVGCAICHVPDMGPAKGVYSDLLLHDMGPHSYDLNHAKPYVRRITPTSRISYEITDSNLTTTSTSTGYYGSGTPMTSTSSSTGPMGSTRGGGSGSSGRSRRTGSTRGFRFVAPTGPTNLLEIIPTGSDSISTVENIDRTSRSNNGSVSVSRTTGTVEATITEERYLRVHIERTNFNQEWRTAPLWGLKDSAPYMHDGRAETVLEAITMHGGEAAGTRDRFLALPLSERHALLAFLDTMVAPDAPRPPAEFEPSPFDSSRR